jgi:hypothetical protein
MKTTPLPPTREDPSLVAAAKVTTEATAKIASIRANRDLSDLAKARQIDAAYTAVMTERARLWDDLQGRRLARLQDLQSLLPFGPGITENTSAADQAVLQAAFRANVEKAREASADGLREMLADAVRFGDELMRRAVYTVATDQGRVGVVWRDMQAADPEMAKVAQEIGEISAYLEGRDFTSRAWERQAFAPIPKPQEVFDLSVLLQAGAARPLNW